MAKLSEPIHTLLTARFARPLLATHHSVLFSALALASVVGAKLVIGLLPKVGWKGIFGILAGISGFNLVLLKLFKRERAKKAAWE